MGCFSSKPKKSKVGVQPPTEARLATPPVQPPLDSVRSPVQLIIPPSPPSRISIKSRFSLQDVQTTDYTPHSTSRQVYKYSCPICLKYLSTVLVTACCGNYICHFCVEEFRATQADVRCPMCNAETVELGDVDPTAEVKRYSDSPLSTKGQGRSTQGQTKWVAKLAIVEEDQKLANEQDDDLGIQSIPRLLPGNPALGLAATA